jgi:hypothetical protein
MKANFRQRLFPHPVQQVSATIMRTKRLVLRLSLLLVIAGGLLGARLAAGLWQVETVELAALAGDGSTDWTELIAVIAEEAIQLFFGFTSGQ